MDQSARPDDGSPARLIAIMVGIVGILLLGSLAWSAVGALFSALADVTSNVSFDRPTPTGLSTLVGSPTATLAAAAEPTRDALTTPLAAQAPTVPAATATPPLEPTPLLPATPAPKGRAPWVLLPQPAPDSRVAPGALVVEARARGDAAITGIRLDLDGAPLTVSLEQRSESTWRGWARTNVSSGHHAVRATVVDDTGRSGGFRWTFDAGP